MAAKLNGTFSNSDVDSLETVLEISVDECDTFFMSFSVGTAVLSDFNVDCKVHKDGDWFTVAGVAADYTAPEGPILGCSGDLTTAATSGVHWLKLDVTAVEMLRIQAAGTSSTISGHWGAK